MRLIDADAFDKCLLGAEIEATKNQKYVFSSAINTIRGNLVNFPTVNQWIPVSERLPELYRPVLVTGGDVIWICELIESPDLDDGEFQWEDKMLGHWYSFDNWDAWMPLPEPWKGEEG